MKCKDCKTGEIIKLSFFGHTAEACDKCTKCPNCGNPGAKISTQFGVLNCNGCNTRLNKIGEKPKDTRSLKTKEDHWATPFWKHMGLKAKPHELAQEREMKRRGLTYRDLQKARNRNVKPNKEMRKITKLALEGGLVDHVKKINDNRRQRPSGKSS